jgi:hypothetical protein
MDVSKKGGVRPSTATVRSALEDLVDGPEKGLAAACAAIEAPAALLTFRAREAADHGEDPGCGSTQAIPLKRARNGSTS